MSLSKIVTVNGLEPAPLSLLHTVGVPLDLYITLRSFAGQRLNPDNWNPQLALRPRASSNVYAYDVDTYDAANGIGRVQVPGNFFNDRSDYTLELYARDVDGIPTQLLAAGTLRLDGGAYGSQGPLGPMTLPVLQGPTGPMGPQGPMGVPGETGADGAPGPTGPKGDTGATGATGATGTPGTPGAPGATGPQGPAGASGTMTAVVAATAPVSPVNGTLWYDTSTQTMRVWNSGLGAWQVSTADWA
jgi:hypothetical protein